MSRFEFAANLVKALETEDEKKPHVIAIASDSSEDRHGDRMSEECIKSMVDQAKESGIDLLENHKSSFAIGKTTGATVEKSVNAHKFAVEFELDTDYPQAKKLFKSVQEGVEKYQLSIGGYVPLDDPEALLFEQREDGTLRRVINKITLDHIAVTRKNHAANNMTGFRHAVMKSLDDLKDPTLTKETLLSITEGLLKDQGAESTLTITPAQVRSSAVRLISQYVNLDITPPSSLLHLSKGFFGHWTPEKASEWETFKESILGNTKENTMAEETKVETEKVTGFDIAKSFSSLKDGLATVDLNDEATKASLHQFMDELVQFAGYKAPVAEETKETEKESPKEPSAIDAMLEKIEAGIKMNKEAKDAIDALNASAKTDLEKLADSIKSSVEVAIAKAIEALKTDFDSKVSEVEKRVKKVEELEGEPSVTLTEKSSDDEDRIWDGVFGGPIFKRKMQ